MSGLLRFCLVCSLATAWSSASAQGGSQVVAEPPQAVIARADDDDGGFKRVAGVAPMSGGGARLMLDLQYTDSQIFNPATGRFDKVHLRSYRNPGSTTPAVPFVAPTISVYPGETVRVSLNNKLPRETGCSLADAPPDNHNIPHCFNSSNLHAHGLWISPSGNSDNVLITLRPGVSFQYEYNIPADHPAGTFWYHPHQHGSTALQVSSGMAGALIIRGTRLPTSARTGDIDTLLRQSSGAPVPERVVLLQQVQYACRDTSGKIKTQKSADGKTVSWICDPGDIGGLEGYDQFGPFSWGESGRYTSINGRILPVFTDVRAGNIERWRIIDAGVRDTIQVQFRKLRMSAATPGKLRPAQQNKWISENCTGELLSQWEIAADGLTHGQMIRKTSNTMQPGYRSDVLMVFPEAGNYCMLDAAAPADGNVNAVLESRQLLGFVSVGEGTNVTGDPQAYLRDQLIAAAQRFMPPSISTSVVADLRQNLRTRAFMPHPNITDDEITGHQSVTFNIDLAKSPPEPTIDGKLFDQNNVRTLVLGDVEEWTLTSKFIGHPFHIHVNPFQIVKILDPDGNDVSVSGEPGDSQYANLKGTWKDTIFVKQDYKVVVRSRYRRYTGDFVLHCHILDHEDLGMMQMVRVVLPDGEGGAMPVGHHH